jgi:hypothetical protein
MSFRDWTPVISFSSTQVAIMAGRKVYPMKAKVCPPRIFGRAIFAGVILLATTFAFAHNPGADSVDATAAAQWKAGAPQIQLEGQIEIVHQDFKDGHGKFVYTLKQADGTRVPLQFVKHPPTHLLTGDHVQVSGQRSSGGLILYSGGNVKNSGGGGSSSCTADSGTCSTTTSSFPVPNTLGSQSTLLIAVNFQDNTLVSCDSAAAWNEFSSIVNNFVAENSYGQTSVTGTGVGCYTIPESITTCNTSAIATDAQNAATAHGVSLANYTRYVYLFPLDSTCGFAGASTVGGNPSQSWLNGTLDPHVVDHEFGHALGLWHSHLLDCGTSSTVCSNGTSVEYGDQMDVMGTVQSAYPDYNAFQKERLGWLNFSASPSIQTVTSSGTYTIYPLELAGPGPNALKVLQSTNSTTGAKTWYYLEARQAIGFDAFLTTWPYSSTQNTTTGVLFHLGTDGDGNSSLLLNMTPGTPTYDFEMSLPAGQSFSDTTAGVTFTPTSVGSTSATVQIALSNSPVCTQANPSISVSPSQSQSVTSGTPVNFTVTVTDNDSSGCSAATFNLGSTLLSGWAGVWNAAGLSLTPGKSGSATLTVTSPTGTADGSYNVGVSAMNASTGSYNGSAAATYVINTAPLTVSLTTNQSSYLPGQTVGVIVTMLYGTTPDVGASVSVAVTNPNGKTTTLSGTTGSNGVALLSYKLSRHAPAGTYQAQYGTTVTGAAYVMGASTSFTVQ